MQNHEHFDVDVEIFCTVLQINTRTIEEMASQRTQGDSDGEYNWRDDDFFIPK